ncbi:MAG: alpha/beta hydrolase domain-containing protein, partial [Bryobacteraceae bacterium]
MITCFAGVRELMRLVKFLACAWVLASAHAAVVKIDVQSRSDVLGGQKFASAGSYERITGKVHFAIDPSHRLNKGITDVHRAPRNSAGLIEFSADFYMMRPVELRKGNGTVLFEVPNRGKKRMLQMFNRARSSNVPITAEDFGDALLLNEGYTLVWLGWQHDAPQFEGSMRIYAPVAT